MLYANSLWLLGLDCGSGGEKGAFSSQIEGIVLHQVGRGKGLGPEAFLRIESVLPTRLLSESGGLLRFAERARAGQVLGQHRWPVQGKALEGEADTRFVLVVLL